MSIRPCKHNKVVIKAEKYILIKNYNIVLSLLVLIMISTADEQTQCKYTKIQLFHCVSYNK